MSANEDTLEKIRPYVEKAVTEVELGYYAETKEIVSVLRTYEAVKLFKPATLKEAVSYTRRKHGIVLKNGSRAQLAAQPANYSVTADFTSFSKDYVMPEGIDESKPPFILDCKKLWVGNDFHFPFQDREAIMAALTKAEDCDTILLNGDVLDCYALSRYIKNPMHRMFKRELDLVRDFLQYLNSRFKGKRKLFKFGNHEKRHQDYIFNNAEAISDLEETKLEQLLKLEMYGFEYVHHTQLIRAGKLNIIHGHEFGGGASTINVGRSLLLKSFDNIMFGHWHVENSYPARKINQDIVGSWAVGCLCKLRPEYRPYNNWTHGFATVEFDGEYFQVHNKKIMNGKIF